MYRSSKNIGISTTVKIWQKLKNEKAKQNQNSSNGSNAPAPPPPVEPPKSTPPPPPPKEEPPPPPPTRGIQGNIYIFNQSTFIGQVCIRAEPEYLSGGLAFDFKLRFEHPLFIDFFLSNTCHPLRNGSQFVRLAEHLHQQQTVRQ